MNLFSMNILICSCITFQEVSFFLEVAEHQSGLCILPSYFLQVYGVYYCSMSSCCVWKLWFGIFACTGLHIAEHWFYWNKHGNPCFTWRAMRDSSSVLISLRAANKSQKKMYVNITAVKEQDAASTSSLTQGYKVRLVLWGSWRTDGPISKCPQTNRKKKKKKKLITNWNNIF